MSHDAFRRDVTRCAIAQAGNVTFWASVASRARGVPNAEGQALGYAWRNALELIEDGAEPRDVRQLLRVAAIGAEP